MYLLQKIGALKPYIGAFLTAIAVLMTGMFLEGTETRRFQEKNRADVLNEASTIRARLEGAINSRLLLVESLMLDTTIHPDISQDEFALMARLLLAKYPEIRSANLAKNSIITHIYPLKGNENAIGLNLIAKPEQKEAVERAIKQNKSIVAGPVKLVQGGIAFINRTPIFILSSSATVESKIYWGFASIVVDVDTIYKEAGLFDKNTSLRYTLRGKDGLGEKGEVFFGDAKLFQENPILLSVTLPNGSWQLGALPEKGSLTYSPLGIWIEIGSVVMALLGGSLVFILISAPLRLQIAVDNATLALRQSQKELQQSNFDLLQAQEMLGKTNEKLEETVNKRTMQLAVANREIMELNELLQTENTRLGAELEVVRKIQQMILPKPEEIELIKDLDIAAYMEPATEVGGDYYDILQINGVITIGIGDVTGHGLESGILMVMTQTAICTLQHIYKRDNIDFLVTLNRTIYHNLQRMKSDKILTLSILNYCQGKMTITGQHEEIIVVRDRGSVEIINTGDLGFPIGLCPDISDWIDSMMIELYSGDGIVLYTDGITEAENLKKKHYGLERLCDIIAHNWDLSAQEIINIVINDVHQYIGEQKIFDDLTLLVIKKNKDTALPCPYEMV
jgi:serine phosphatase RsbU (regulator of sigma subunit)/sensor domain CHASE-containing protein